MKESEKKESQCTRATRCVKSKVARYRSVDAGKWVLGSHDMPWPDKVILHYNNVNTSKCVLSL